MGHPVTRHIAAGALAAVVAACATSAGSASPAGSTIPAISPSAVPSSSPTAAATHNGSSPAIRMPAFEPDEPLVLFTRVTGAGGGIFVLRPDGTGLTQLATDILPGVHKRGSWSPDGQSVVLIDETTERMWVAHLDGSPTVSVPVCDRPGCDFPSWSPDGKRLAFSRTENGAFVGPAALAVYVVEIATNEVTQVVRLERPLLADQPRWSPDGDRIVFNMERMDDEAFDTGAGVAIVPVSGGEPRFITDLEQFGSVPDWGWKTNEIVYSVQLLDAQRQLRPDQVTWDLYGVRPDGSNKRQITHVEKGHRLLGPRWTADGTAITAYDATAEQPVLVDPVTGAITPFATPGVETRPLLRPVP